MEKFSWINVYQKIAYKILEYKNNSKQLVDLMYKSLEDVGLMKSEEEGSYLDSDGKKRCRYEEIDPISFMNRFDMYSFENRCRLIESFQKKAGMEIDVPSDFDGVPSTNAQMSMIIRFKYEREDDDVANIWELFDIALRGDINNKEDREKFVYYYNKVTAKPIAKFNVSVGLFKVRPDVYINLDKTNRGYINEKFNIKINKCPTGEEYLDIIEQIKSKLEVNNETLLDLSYNAWLSKENNTKKEENQKEDLKKQKYFWLNANPKIWSFSQLKNGEVIEYTAINPNGNKRRIYKNYQEAKRGDLVIAYEATPTKAIVGICIIEEELKNNSLKVKKIEELVNPIPYFEIQGMKELENMEYITNPQGSLFALTKKEYDIIIDMIRNQNHISKNKIQKYTKEDFLNDVYIMDEEYNKLVNLLYRKKNIILQGAPGVGKTYTAKRLAYSIIGKKDDERIKCIQFHQSYSYEDFIEGFRPTENTYNLKKGRFYDFCKLAENNPDKPYFFVIDEINRGNLSKIFGELLMLIECDKRGEKLNLAYSDDEFTVPSNLYIIGMMNTADRSLALIDYALRRRFAFYKLKPAFKNQKFIQYKNNLNNIKFNKLIELIIMLNIEINKDLSLGEGFEIGHSYFCELDKVTDEDVELIIKYEILPLIEEYWFDDIDKYNEWKDKLNGVIND